MNDKHKLYLLSFIPSSESTEYKSEFDAADAVEEIKARL